MLVFDKVNILHECHCGYCPSQSGKESAGLFRIVTYHHEIVVKLGEDGFDAFSESLIAPRWWSPVLLIVSVRKKPV